MKTKKNIFLCGFMGVGKTTVGKNLAKTLNFKYFDTDTMIEKSENMIVSEIFALKGEQHFRIIEADTLNFFIGKNNCIISTGGGIVLKNENIENMRKSGFLIHLSAQPETILSRINIETRPLLKNTPLPQLPEKIKIMLNDRKARYELCDFSVETDDKNISEITAEIISLTRMQYI